MIIPNQYLLVLSSKTFYRYFWNFYCLILDKYHKLSTLLFLSHITIHFHLEFFLLDFLEIIFSFKLIAKIHHFIFSLKQFFPYLLHFQSLFFLLWIHRFLFFVLALHFFIKVHLICSVNQLILFSYLRISPQNFPCLKDFKNYSNLIKTEGNIFISFQIAKAISPCL